MRPRQRTLKFLTNHGMFRQEYDFKYHRVARAQWSTMAQMIGFLHEHHRQSRALHLVHSATMPRWRTIQTRVISIKIAFVLKLRVMTNPSTMPSRVLKSKAVLESPLECYLKLPDGHLQKCRR